MKAKNYKNSGLLKKNRLIRFEQEKNLCEWCKKEAQHIHHKDKSLDNHSLGNLVVLCKDCHLKKAHHTGEKWSEARKKSKPITVFVREYGCSAKEISKIVCEPIFRINYWHSLGELKEKILLKAPLKIILSTFPHLLHK